MNGTPSTPIQSTSVMAEHGAFYGSNGAERRQGNLHMDQHGGASRLLCRNPEVGVWGISEGMALPMHSPLPQPGDGAGAAN